MANNGMLSMISSFDRNKMKQTKTRVRTPSGEIYEEKIQDGKVITNYVSTEIRPAYLEDNLNGFSVIVPGKYDANLKKWTNFIYNENTPINSHDCNKISFITFNVWFWERYLKERALFFFGILENLRPDFVCLQEVTAAFLELLKQHPFIQSHYIISDFHGNTVIPYGTMILSHYPLSSLRIHSLPSNQGRRLLDAEIILEKPPGEAPTKKINIATIHLESCDNEVMRKAQLDIIFPIISTFNNSFFMGDFNFPDCSDEETHTPQQYKDLWKEINKGYSGGRGGEVVATTDRGRYDRLLYCSSLFLGTSVSLIGTEDIKELSTESEMVYPSDHKGLYCTFSIKSDSCRD